MLTQLSCGGALVGACSDMLGGKTCCCQHETEALRTVTMILMKHSVHKLKIRHYDTTNTCVPLIYIKMSKQLT